MTPYYDHDGITLYHGDCRDVLHSLPDASADAVVTDPPNELGFMGKRWDASGITYKVRLWKEVLRVLKPGGHLLAFGGTRTYHRLVCAIEDAGFEIRDSIHWIYGQGFPKSLNVSKAIDKAAGVEREVIGTRTVTRDVRPHKGNNWGNPEISDPKREIDVTTPATDDAKQWDGWGTALKPAHEPIVLARKPLSERNVADNVRKHGTGALNIDGCRVNSPGPHGTAGRRKLAGFGVSGGEFLQGLNGTKSTPHPIGRWPANLVLDEAAACALDVQSGGASRFFYVAKASPSERHAGLDQPNRHPTVKPIALMRWLCRLITPPGGVVLDPFAGSGSTGCAAVLEGFRFLGIERDATYVEIARQRIAHWAAQRPDAEQAALPITAREERVA